MHFVTLKLRIFTLFHLIVYLKTSAKVLMNVKFPRVKELPWSRVIVICTLNSTPYPYSFVTPKLINAVLVNL